MSLSLDPDLAALLYGIRADLAELRNEARADLSALRALVAGMATAPPLPAPPPQPPKRWYSVEEAAALLGKAPYTIREWCRHGQIVAQKRAERRGGSALWGISAEAIERYRSDGLLPIEPDRNTSN